MRDVLRKIVPEILDKHDVIAIYSVFGVHYLHTSAWKQAEEQCRPGGCKSWGSGGVTTYIYIYMDLDLGMKQTGRDSQSTRCLAVLC